MATVLTLDARSCPLQMSRWFQPSVEAKICPQWCGRLSFQLFISRSAAICKERKGLFTHSVPCRAVPMPYTMLPCLINTCHAVLMPRSYRAPTMPSWKRLLKATAEHGMGTAWYLRISLKSLNSFSAANPQRRLRCFGRQLNAVEGSERALL